MRLAGKILVPLVLLLAFGEPALAQTPDSAPTPAPQAQPANQPAPTADLLKPEQLEALVAPIALYPDELLANVLAASTYPLEVVQADRWLKERKSLKGDALRTEVDKQAWDDSVKALASTPEVLTMMSDKLDWTQKLGDTFLAQQPDVMDAIQRLRTKAYDNKKLVTTKQQKVSVQTQENKQVVVIEPAESGTMYVPYYEPATVYGAWPYTEYPPYYFGYPSYIGAGVVAAGLAFGTAWAIGRWGNYWGGGCNWGSRNVYVNHRTTNIGNGWQHNPAHRQGVRYNNTNIQQRFGNNNLKAGAADRMDFRGRDGQQVLRPNQGAGDRAGDRASASTRDRPGGGDRAGAADRAKGGGDRAKGGSAKGGGDRAKATGGGDRAKAANRGGASAGNRAAAANRGGGGNRGGAMNVSSGRAASAASARGRSSMASMPRGGGGGASFSGGRGGGGMSAGGGGFRGGGGGGRGGGGGGRRSDIALKHDVVLLGHLASGIGYYRFSYLGSNKAYVGVLAQEVESVKPEAVTRGSDGYLRVYYERLGLKFRTYSDWLAGGARIPAEALP